MSTDAPVTPVTVSMTPVADLAVRQAHRNLDRINVSTVTLVGFEERILLFQARSHTPAIGGGQNF